MSNLTKILIVLLTISSIFLCGIVVTYVANADNFKQKYAAVNSEKDSLKLKVEGLTKQLDEKIQQKDELEKALNNQIGTMKTQVSDLKTSLTNIEREKAELLEKVNSWASITKDFTATTEQQAKTLNTALEDVKQLKAEQIKISHELDEASAALTEKMAIMETLTADKQRLIEEKSDIQTRLDKLLQSAGKVTTAGQPVTLDRKGAMQAQSMGEPIALKCLVSAVDIKGSLATISIGSADGVKEGMKFHVTRGDEFICDILVIDVDTDKAVGTLELVQSATGGPKVGDNASTNL